MNVAQARAVRLGLFILVVSCLAAIVWLVFGRPDFCDAVTDFGAFVAAHRLQAFALLMIWSFLLFLTVMPLGTTTILLAGYFLGPMAGVAQFAAMVLASAVIYEVGREQDPDILARRVKDYPVLLKVANIAQDRGLVFSSLSRLVPVIPSAVASLAASFFCLSRRSFYGGTLLVGWVRPVGFAALAAAGHMIPVCGI